MPDEIEWRVPPEAEPKPENYDFDLPEALSAVVGLRARVPADAFTAEVLGTERTGNGVVIDKTGIVLTIGYLITEADEIWLTTNDGRVVPGHPIGFDQETGFGLVQALGRLDIPALALGQSDTAQVGTRVVSAGAGGHTGQLSPFAFIAALRQFFPGLVCVGGGIADGAGVAGAVTAGADLVYMGTRFIAAEESLASPAYKAMLAACSIEDLVVSNAVTGTAASWLKPSLAAAGYDLTGGPVARDYGGDVQKRWKDVWSAGQGLHAVTGVEPMAAIAATLEREFDTAVAGLNARAAGLRR